MKRVTKRAVKNEVSLVFSLIFLKKRPVLHWQEVVMQLGQVGAEKQHVHGHT